MSEHVGLTKAIRWKLWEWAYWLAWWLCPDKKTLSLIQQHGTIMARAALTALSNRGEHHD